MSPSADAAGMFGPGLLAAAFAAPFVILAVFVAPKLRFVATALAPLAPLPALATAILTISGAPFGCELPGLRMSFRLDQPGAMLLAAAALVWIAASIFALADRTGRANADRFAVCWLLTMAGSLGVFIAADLLTFYLAYALVSIPAYYLIADDGEAGSTRAGGVYMAFALIGEAVLLIAFVMLAAGEPGGSLDIRAVVAALPASPLARCGARAPHHRLRDEDRARATQRLDAARLYRGADSGRCRLERRRGQGRRDRIDPLSAARRGFAGLGRGARLGRVRLRLLRRRDWPDSKGPQDDPRLFEHQPDGRDRRGVGDGPRRRRSKRCDGRGLLCRQPCSGEGRALPDRRRRRDARRTRPIPGADRGGGAGAEPRRTAADRRRAGQDRREGPVRRRPGQMGGGGVRGRDDGADVALPHPARAVGNRGESDVAWMVFGRGLRLPSPR